VRALLGEGRKDESGDFTRGAGLNDEQISKVIGLFMASPSSHAQPTAHHGMPYIDLYASADGGAAVSRPIDNTQTIDFMESNLPFNPTFKQGSDELRSISALAESARYGSDQIRIDPSVVRGLEYYTGAVYEVELTFEIKDDDGKPVRFGSVAGGGRYDGLVARFRGESVPATGFSIGVSRLMAALQHLGKVDTKCGPGPVVVTVFDRDRIADYQRMVAALRGAGIRSELYLGNPKNFGNQLKYADKRGSPCVVIQGGNEKEKGEVQIKDLILGAEIAGLSQDRDDYLKKQAEAQFAVKESEMVDAVRKVLARNKVKWG
jgi:histidyl-tRNA synthetase